MKRKNKAMPKGRKVPPKPQPKIERRLPIIPIRLSYGGEEGIKIVEDQVYRVHNPQDNTITEITISKEIISGISAAHALQLFGFGIDRSSERIASTWPSNWQYIDESTRIEVESIGLQVKNPQTFLVIGIHAHEFGRYVYPETDVQGFFDSWIDLLVFEYIVQTELAKFYQLQKEGLFSSVDQLPGSINLQITDAWVALENCAIRIDAMWERLVRYILLLYFTGQFRKNMDKSDWIQFDKEIRAKANNLQLRLYEMLYQANKDYPQQMNHPMKRLRNRMIHEVAQRPQDSVSVGKIEGDLPRTIEEMLSLISEEHSRIRECMVIMAAIIRAKEPENGIVNLIPHQGLRLATKSNTETIRDC